MEREKNKTKLCVYNKYKVKIINEYVYLNEDKDFINDICKKEEIMNGYDLIHCILNLLNDNECIGLTIVENIIRIQMFNPLTGESENYHLSFEDLGME